MAARPLAVGQRTPPHRARPPGSSTVNSSNDQKHNNKSPPPIETARNFHRKATKTTGFLTPTGHTTTRDGGRPAQLYRRGPTALLYPPLMRNAPSDNLDHRAAGTRRSHRRRLAPA